MTVRRLSAVDAQTYWMSARIPNDQFLLYGFAGAPADLDDAMRRVRERALSCDELLLRIRDGNLLSYPQWVRGGVAADQFMVHSAVSWSQCLATVARLEDHQLDPRVLTWRLHCFPSVGGMPGADGGSITVVQMSHALADGVRSAALAAWLFGRDAPVPPVDGPRRFLSATLPWRSYRAIRTHRRLLRDTEAGLVVPQAESCPALRSNSRPEGRIGFRTLVRRRSEVPGPTVTVGVLAAVSTALSVHLRELGDDPSRLRAEVPMAKAGEQRSHNHFGNVGIGLHPDLPVDERTDRIAEEFEHRRRRASHPAMVAASQAFAAVPAPLLRWGVSQFDPTVRSPTVTGNTVVSSVNRGAADLHFGDAPVVLTAGYPGLSPMMGLTHGVHGIGDTIAVSVCAAQSAVGDIDAYVERLDAALTAHLG